MKIGTFKKCRVSVFSMQRLQCPIYPFYLYLIINVEAIVIFLGKNVFNSEKSDMSPCSRVDYHN